MSHGSMRYFDKNSKSGHTSKTINHTRIDSISSIEEKYVISPDILGQGSFGTVYKATNIATGQSFAMKKIDKQTLGVTGHKMLEREVAILKRVQHPHIVALEEVFETSEDTYLFMELCDKGELKSMLDSTELSELECAKIIERLSSTIAYLHDNDIVHRDLKLENILLSAGVSDPDDRFNIKVTDFGLSFLTGGSNTFGNDKMMTTTCGTPMYMAPEILDNSVGYSHQCDIWSIGIIMYILLSRKTPFEADSEDELYEKIKAGDIKFDGSEWENISQSAKTLIKCMVKVDPAARITAKEIRDHHWVKGESDNNNEDSQLTVIEMMKMFHRENLPQADVEIKIAEVKEADAEEKKDVVAEIPAPRKKFTPKDKNLPDNRRMSVDPHLIAARKMGANSPRRTSLPTSTKSSPIKISRNRKPGPDSKREDRKQTNSQTVK
ncbi:hypothetical protein ACHWQZ_G009234 [Mnemiopsis leidyi]